MDIYTGGALDDKITHFLDKRTAKFPELQHRQKREKKYIYAADFKDFVHQYSIILKRFTRT